MWLFLITYLIIGLLLLQEEMPRLISCSLFTTRLLDLGHEMRRKPKRFARLLMKDEENDPSDCKNKYKNKIKK